MAYKTPGVYVKEISTFPPSVVAVETAIPAFIGYTEKAEDEDGKDLSFVPTRIKSFLEFQENYGGDFRPAKYQVVLDTTNKKNAVGSVSPKNAANNDRRYYLYGCLRHFYANGGGPCYIVSVGSYTDDPALGGVSGDPPTPAGLKGGLIQLERYDEPTLLVFPDGVSLDPPESEPVSLGAVQVAALEQCAKLQDRFVIMDLREGHLPTSLSNDPVAKFRQEVGTNNLKYGAAYYPWIRTIYRPEVHFRHLNFIDTKSPPEAIPNGTLDSLTDDTAIDDLVPTARDADTNVGAVVSAVNISGMAGTDRLTLNRNNFADMSDHFGDLFERLRNADATAVSGPLGNLLLLPRAIALAFKTLDTLGAVVSAVNISGMAGSDPLTLNRNNFADLLQHFADLLERLRQTDPTAVSEPFGNLLLLPRAIALAFQTLDTPTLPAKLSQAISSLKVDTTLISQIVALIALEKNPDVLASARRTDDNVNSDYAALNGKAWIGSNATVSDITANNEDFGDLANNAGETALAAASALKQPFDKLAAAILTVFEAAAEFLPAELSEAVSSLSQDATLIAQIVAFIALEKNSDVLASASRTDDNVNSDYEALNGTAWIGSTSASPKNVSEITANNEDFGDPANNAGKTALAAASALQQPFDKIAAAILSVFEAAEFLADEAERQLFGQHPVFRDVVERVERTMSLLPAAGAVAGVYAAVDRTRGVWKAPANVSLTDVFGPAVKVNDEAQGRLNVHSTGKSINAIRSFTGKGTLVWGARTLAGNDNEWRYVPVRRFFNMAEESIKKATEPFTFEPNDANTWVRVRAMIENFLTLQWRAGALAGSIPVQAFYVKVGLGETMTAQDILEGRMIVELGMAVVRPAEFIILKFAHKMQVS